MVTFFFFFYVVVFFELWATTCIQLLTTHFFSYLFQGNQKQKIILFLCGSNPPTETELMVCSKFADVKGRI